MEARGASELPTSDLHVTRVRDKQVGKPVRTKVSTCILTEDAGTHAPAPDGDGDAVVLET